MRVLLFILLYTSTLHAKSALPEVTSGSIHRIAAFASEFVPSRTVDVWLPAGYSAKQRYPVIYMHDGQMLFDASMTWNQQAWDIDDTASRLIQEDRIPPVIIVGVWNSGENRHSEYFPQQPFESLPEETQRQLYKQNGHQDSSLFPRPVYSDDYLKFLVHELKPYIEKQYAIMPDKSFLMGSSMGGLISWYGLMEYPDMFAGAACLSTHWPGDFSKTNNPIPAQFEAYIARNLETLSSHTIYFDYGTATLDAMYPPLQQQINAVFEEANYPSSQWVSKKFEGAAHTESAWAERLEHPLLFLLSKLSQ